MTNPSTNHIWQNQLRPFLSRVKHRAGAPRRWLQQCCLRPIVWLYGGATPAITKLHEMYPLTPQRVLGGYAQAIFPTGEPNGGIVWHCPPQRAVIRTDQVHVSKRLKGYLRNHSLGIYFNRDFSEVLRLCADRKKTWITKTIYEVYMSLHEMGFGHSVEAYEGDQLVGGGYGVALGDVFFLESMFCRTDHASKIAFVKLAEKLLADGFQYIDCQFMTEHWRRFGACEMPRDEFQKVVVGRLHQPATFSASKAAGIILPLAQPTITGALTMH